MQNSQIENKGVEVGCVPAQRPQSATRTLEPEIARLRRAWVLPASLCACAVLALSMPAKAQNMGTNSVRQIETFDARTIPDLAPQNTTGGAANTMNGTASYGANSFEAITLRLTRIEQLLRAQQNLQNADVLTAIEQILTRFDALQGASANRAASPSGQSSGSFDDQQAADLRLRLSALEETSRHIRGQTDEILRLLGEMEENRARASADSEFRFQALEGKLRQRENAGSEEPVVIGTVAPSATISGDAEIMPRSGPLVGEDADNPALESAGTPLEALADPEKLYDRGLALLRDGKYAPAREDFKAILKNYPQHERAGNAQYWLGESYYVERDFKQAAEAFLAGYTVYEKSGKAPDSLLKLGMALAALDQKSTACDAFAELAVKFPDASQAIKKRADIEKNRAGCS